MGLPPSGKFRIIWTILGWRDREARIRCENSSKTYLVGSLPYRRR